MIAPGEVQNGPSFKLRDLAGVLEFELRLAQWSDAVGDTEGAELCRRLFGVTPAETLTSASGSSADPYAPCELPLNEQIDHFARHGWDVTDGAGRPLAVLALVNRPLLAAVLGLMGRLPHSAGVGLAAWAADLESEVRSFHAGRRKRVEVVRRRSGPLRRG